MLTSRSRDEVRELLGEDFNGIVVSDRYSAYNHLDDECYRLVECVHHEGVSPTNNAAEQALRKSVIFRKLSFGTEAQTGSLKMTFIMSVAETCRRLGQRPLSYIHNAVKAAFCNQPAPNSSMNTE